MDAILTVMLAEGQPPTEQELKNIIQNVQDRPPDPEHEAFLKELNETETAKASLPFADAESPVRYNLDEVNHTEIPYTAPGQISIFVSSEYERKILNPDQGPNEPVFLDETETLPNPWSGNIRFDSGSKSVSYSGVGKDVFIMDCLPGTPYGVIFQNGEDSGSLNVLIEGSDYSSYGSPERLESESTNASYGVISMSGTCPSFDPAIAEELLSYRNDR